jgi:inner membrane transporter RhtA
VAASAVSVQFGAAIATHLFSRVGPTGAVTLRLVLASVILAGVLRPRHLAMSRADLGVAVAFGVAMAAMNLTFYEAISRVPLGVAVTVEFAGPLAVTIVGTRRRTDLLWAVLAGGGVVLLSSGGGRHLDLVGVGMALVAGGCWAAYIILSKETGRRFPGGSGLAVAMVVSAAVVLPIGLATAAGRMLHPEALGLGAAVALLSSALPYSLELTALRRVTPRAFGVLLSLDPAVAALVGLVALGQHLSWRELVALGLVVAANAGNALVGEGEAVTASGVVPD